VVTVSPGRRPGARSRGRVDSAGPGVLPFY